MAKYRFDQIAINCKEKAKAESIDISTYIGLEHLDSGSLQVSRWGSAVPIKGDKIVMHKGDVLFGKRNAYLRRAAIAPHDGAFSAHGMVFRAREDVVNKAFFPLFIASDYFFNTAIRISVGSLSPTVNWSDLKDQEFELPDLDTQQKLAEVLWSINDTMEAYKRLISATDALVKSQFIDMFGNLGEDEKGWGLTTLGKCCVLNPKRPKDINDDLLVSFVPMPAVSEDGRIDTSEIKPYVEVKKGLTYFAEKDVLFAKITPCMENGKGCIAEGLSNGIGSGSTEFHVLRPIPGRSNPYWLYILTTLDAFRSAARKSMTGTGGQLRVPLGFLDDYPITLPPIEMQEMFEAIVRQSDKSKFELEQALSELNATYKSIIAENLG